MFDKWKPPHFIKDNLNKKEREFLKEVLENKDIVYMWEDKGPFFVKMTKEQYLKAGEKELEDEHTYKVIEEDPSDNIRIQNAILVDEIVRKDEISEKVAEFLKAGESKVSKYYHLLKTHKIPISTENPTRWLEENGFPLRGIVSGCGSPTERLSGFVDHHLQDGMKSLDSFLRDTKDTLKVIEELNDKVDEGELNLEGVALVSLDIVSM